MINILQQIEERKKKNLEELRDRGYSLIDNHPSTKKKVFVKIDSNSGKICGSPCVYCFNHTKLNPFRNGAYIFTICQECLLNISIIELSKTNSEVTSKNRRVKRNPKDIKIDWDHLERLINKGQAKLTLLAQKYKLYTNEIKELIYNKYKNKILFKKGRGGGLVWNTNNECIKKKDI